MLKSVASKRQLKHTCVHLKLHNINLVLLFGLGTESQGVFSRVPPLPFHIVPSSLSLPSFSTRISGLGNRLPVGTKRQGSSVSQSVIKVWSSTLQPGRKHGGHTANPIIRRRDHKKDRGNRGSGQEKGFGGLKLKRYCSKFAGENWSPQICQLCHRFFSQNSFGKVKNTYINET